MFKNEIGTNWNTLSSPKYQMHESKILPETQEAGKAVGPSQR